MPSAGGYPQRPTLRTPWPLLLLAACTAPPEVDDLAVPALLPAPVLVDDQLGPYRLNDGKAESAGLDVDGGGVTVVGRVHR